jgi:hypothetical protein
MMAATSGGMVIDCLFMFVAPIGKFPRIRGGVLLIADNGVSGFAGGGTPGVNGYAVIGTVIDVPGFPGGFTVREYPADFEFPPLRDKGGVFEYFENVDYTHFFHSVKKFWLPPVHDGIMGGAFRMVYPKIRSPLFRLSLCGEVPAQGMKVTERNKGGRR